MNDNLVSEVLASAPEMNVGDFAVVCLSWESKVPGWNTGRVYGSQRVAASQQTREINQNDCRAYIVRRHAGGRTVYLGPGHVLGTVAA